MKRRENLRRFGGFNGCNHHAVDLTHGGFRVNTKIRKQSARRKRQILRRLDKDDNRGGARPIMTASNIHDEFANRGPLKRHWPELP